MIRKFRKLNLYPDLLFLRRAMDTLSSTPIMHIVETLFVHLDSDRFSWLHIQSSKLRLLGIIVSGSKALICSTKHISGLN